MLTTIAIGSLKVFDIVRTMTGGQFGTSVVANEFYTQAFRQSNQGLGAALAMVLFILVVPIVVYNVRQMRISEERPMSTTDHGPRGQGDRREQGGHAGRRRSRARPRRRRSPAHRDRRGPTSWRRA